MKVLIVDDNETNRKLLRINLEGEGIETFEAEDGVEALEKLEHERADAIISDILMPRMDGYRFCQEVRKSERPAPRHSFFTPAPTPAWGMRSSRSIAARTATSRSRRR